MLHNFSKETEKLVQSLQLHWQIKWDIIPFSSERDMFRQSVLRLAVSWLLIFFSSQIQQLGQNKSTAWEKIQVTDLSTDDTCSVRS